MNVQGATFTVDKNGEVVPLKTAANDTAPKAEPQTNATNDQYTQRLHDALEEAYAPLKRGGPSLLRIFGLIVKEIFHPEPPVPRDQSVDATSPKGPEPAR